MEQREEVNVISPSALGGKVVLVTGGGTGIGRAIAMACARAGATVAVTGRRLAPLEETVEAIRALGVEALALNADIREPAEVSRLVERVCDAFGQVDVLVNNAGGQFQKPAEQITVNGWRAVHRLAVEAAWSMTREVAVRSMIPRRQGVVLFLSFSPRRGISGMVHATSARAAIENLASGLALEWSSYGIRSLAIAAGTIQTEGLTESYTPEAIAGWGAAVPLRRLGKPEEVAQLAVFLASDAAAYMTGTTVVVDGGADAWGTGQPAPPFIPQHDQENEW